MYSTSPLALAARTSPPWSTRTDSRPAAGLWPRVWHMPARKRPGPAEAAAASRILLDELAGGRDLSDIAAEMAALHPRHDTFPGEVFLRIAADALGWCGARRADPVPLEGLRERFLAGCSFRGRERSRLQYAVLAAAAISGGAEPDLLDEVACWQTDDFWLYAMYAAAAFIGLAADRAGVPVSRVCRELENYGPASRLADGTKEGVRWRGPGCRSAWT